MGIRMFDQAIKKSGQRVILDGFPRNMEQAEYLDRQYGKPFAVINLTASEDVLISRLTARHEGRSDDHLPIIRKRLVEFHKQTLPLLEHYKKHGIVFEIRAKSKYESPKHIHHRIIRALDDKDDKDEIIADFCDLFFVLTDLNK